jgi:hypothetical protein
MSDPSENKTVGHGHRRLTIALPLLLATAPAHASHWEMTCPNVRADLPPDTISSDPERGYLLVSGASGNTLYLVDRISSRDEPLVIQAYRPRGQGLLLLAFDDNKPGLIRFLVGGNDYLPKQTCSVATHVPTERYSPHDNLPLPSLPDVEYLVDNPQTKAAFDARFGDGSADGILPVVDARLDTPAFRQEIAQQAEDMRLAAVRQGRSGAGFEALADADGGMPRSFALALPRLPPRPMAGRQTGLSSRHDNPRTHTWRNLKSEGRGLCL